jgi:hypothetical protein
MNRKNKKVEISYDVEGNFDKKILSGELNVTVPDNEKPK